MAPPQPRLPPSSQARRRHAERLAARGIEQAAGAGKGVKGGGSRGHDRAHTILDLVIGEDGLDRRSRLVYKSELYSTTCRRMNSLHWAVVTRLSFVSQPPSMAGVAEIWKYASQHILLTAGDS